ncbi:MAG: BIR-domain-containing protein [Amphiamblys sp. WSBS2006]|nr:MAG: BIR-domain-containing protein [Amphiamblys sp. WSBS2006]
MDSVVGRLSAFKKTPWKHQENDKYYAGDKDLAYAGFYPNPTPKKKDNVTCFYCQKSLCDWDPEDIPWEQHRTASPDCILANLHLLENRLALFEVGHWDRRGRKKATAKQFAEAGFFFYPYDETDDSLMCYHCGLGLDNWEADDDPSAEHAKRNPRCPHLVLNRVCGKTAFGLHFARDSILTAKRKLSVTEEESLRQKNDTSIEKMSISQTVGGYLEGAYTKVRKSLGEVFESIEGSVGDEPEE